MSRESSSLKSIKEVEIVNNISLVNYSSWRIGGTAEYFAEPKDIRELKYLLEWSNYNKIPFHLIGAGSNLLISDQKIKGLIICTRKLHGLQINEKSGYIEALAGESLPTLARTAAKAGLHGLEWSVGIPGTVGGATVMNAGAQQNCMADWISAVRVMQRDSSKQFLIKKEDLEFSYRQSLFQKKPLIVIATEFLLKPGYNSKELSQTTNENLAKRIKTQPYKTPSCGSVFRNPEPLKAGELIEKLGMKGMRIGGAEISELHSNFIINTGQATSEDVCKLIALVQKKVKDEHGVLLHPEVKKLGF